MLLLAGIIIVMIKIGPILIFYYRLSPGDRTALQRINIDSHALDHIPQVLPKFEKMIQINSN